MPSPAPAAPTATASAPVAAEVAADAPILLFDSGMGGLSVLRAVRRALPTVPVVYAADYAGLPYGEKTDDELAARVPALLGRLTERFHPRLAIIACNTASTVALAHVRAALDLPIIGTVPAIKPAAAISRTRTIAVLGTPSTIRQPYVDRLAADHAADCRVLRHGSSALVHAAEAMLRGGRHDDGAVVAAIEALRALPGGGAIDACVLACTHFPLLLGPLRAAAPADWTFVDGADGIARRAVHLTLGQPMPVAPAPGIAVMTVGRTPPLPDAVLAREGLGPMMPL